MITCLSFVKAYFWGRVQKDMFVEKTAISTYTRDGEDQESCWTANASARIESSSGHLWKMERDCNDTASRREKSGTNEMETSANTKTICIHIPVHRHMRAHTHTQTQAAVGVFPSSSYTYKVSKNYVKAFKPLHLEHRPTIWKTYKSFKWFASSRWKQS